MPVIQFDVLIPVDRAAGLRDVFDRAVGRLVDGDRATGGSVTLDPQPPLADGIEAQLRATYREEHDGAELADAAVARYRITVEGLDGSVNQLTMALSRILTPQADLPADPVLLENELAHELPATYPWAVEIRR